MGVPVALTVLEGSLAETFTEKSTAGMGAVAVAGAGTSTAEDTSEALDTVAGKVVAARAAARVGALASRA